MTEYSMVIRNARIVDGTGGGAFLGDVAVDADRIAAIGDIAGRGTQEVDAGGLVLAPGFIDVHTHYDPQLCWDRLATPTPEHGVTSMIMGNCSVSLAPVRPAIRERLIEWFGSVEDMDGGLMRRNVSFGWETFEDYLTQLRQGVAPNVGVFVGHAVLRLYVMGDAAQERAATAEEITEMATVLRRALAAGAFGLSFTFNHLDERGAELPCTYADRRELTALLNEVAAAGRMVEVAPNFRAGVNPLASFDLFGALSLETGARVSLSPILVMRQRPGEWKQILDCLEGWRAKGADLFAQTQVRPLDITVNLGDGSLLFTKTNTWRQVMNQPLEGKIAMLSDPANREVLRNETDTLGGTVQNLVLRSTQAPENQKYLNTPLRDIAARLDRHLSDVMIDLALADGLKTEFTITGVIHADVAEVSSLLMNSAMHIGSADAGAHITSFSGAGDTCYLFEKFVRAEGLIPLEKAVQRFTSDIARDWRIADRGEIVIGKFADLVIFDPETIARGAETWVDDLPGGGGRYVRGATGISKVIVNGKLVVDGAAYTGELPGRII